MYRNIYTLITILVLSFALFQCEEPPKHDEDQEELIENDAYEIERYSYTEVPDNKPAPVYAIADTNGGRTIFYGAFKSNVLVRINHLVHESLTQNPIVASFNLDGKVNSISQIDPVTGEKVIDYIVYADESFTYVKNVADDDFIKISRNETVTLAEEINAISDDKRIQMIDNLMLANQLTFENLNWYLNNNTSKKSSQEQTGEELLLESVIGVVVAGIVIYKTVKWLQNGGVQKITKDTELESNSIEELYTKSCAKLSGNKKSGLSGNSSLMCSNNQSDITNILNNQENQNVNPCGTSICYTDCNGVEGGSAYWDKCGDCVGGNTGNSECQEDCNGTPGGSAFLDDCGSCVGGSTGKAECVEDCNGTPGGSAYIDDCGDCVGGSTGNTECNEDCNGTPNGTAYTDNCGVCVGGTTGNTECSEDCNGTPDGTAFVDNCGTCVGGTTGKTECTEDCSGTPDGTAYLDNCGDCVGGSTGNDPCEEVTDCAGIVNGSAYTDQCGNCVGGTTGNPPCDTIKKKKIVVSYDI